MYDAISTFYHEAATKAEQIAFKARQEALYYKLKGKLIEGESTLYDVSNAPRGMGKSTVLVRLSNEFNLPLFTRFRSSERYLVDTLGAKPYLVKSLDSFHLSSLRYGIILVDEGFTREYMQDGLMKCANILVGYAPLKF